MANIAMHCPFHISTQLLSRNDGSIERDQPSRKPGQTGGHNNYVFTDNYRHQNGPTHRPATSPRQDPSLRQSPRPFWTLPDVKQLKF